MMSTTTTRRMSDDPTPPPPISPSVAYLDTLEGPSQLTVAPAIDRMAMVLSPVCARCGSTFVPRSTNAHVLSSWCPTCEQRAGETFPWWRLSTSDVETLAEAMLMASIPVAALRGVVARADRGRSHQSPQGGGRAQPSALAVGLPVGRRSSRWPQRMSSATTSPCARAPFGNSFCRSRPSLHAPVRTDRHVRSSRAAHHSRHPIGQDSSTYPLVSALERQLAAHEERRRAIDAEPRSRTSMRHSPIASDDQQPRARPSTKKSLVNRPVTALLHCCKVAVACHFR